MDPVDMPDSEDSALAASTQTWHAIAKINPRSAVVCLCMDMGGDWCITALFL